MGDLNDYTQNVNIWNDEKAKSVTVTTDGSKERLDVNTQDIEVDLGDDMTALLMYQRKILKELKAINMQLAIMTDNILENEEID